MTALIPAPRTFMELDFIDGERIFNAWCEDCDERHEFDSQRSAEDFCDSHECPEGDGDDD